LAAGGWWLVADAGQSYLFRSLVLFATMVNTIVASDCDLAEFYDPEQVADNERTLTTES
jgi:hypothetical protein